MLKKKLKNVYRKRWVEQIIWLDDFQGLFLISFCIETMNFNKRGVCNKKTSSKAPFFTNLRASFDCITTLVLTKSILDLDLTITELLQGK